MRPPKSPEEDEDPNRLAAPLLVFCPPNVNGVAVEDEAPNMAFFAPGPSSSDGFDAPNRGLASLDVPKTEGFDVPDDPKVKGSGATAEPLPLGAVVAEGAGPPKRGMEGAVVERVERVDPNRGVEEEVAEDVEVEAPKSGRDDGMDDPPEGAPNGVDLGAESVEEPNKGTDEIVDVGGAVDVEPIDEEDESPNEGAGVVADVASGSERVDAKRGMEGAGFAASPLVEGAFDPNTNPPFVPVVPIVVVVEGAPNIGLNAAGAAAAAG